MMVVRVVSEKPVKARQVTCTKCAYRLEYTGEDVSTVTRTDYTGDSDEYHYIKCPRCAEKVFVKAWPAGGD